MTECPTGPLGITECVQALIDEAAKVGAHLHIDTQAPLDPRPHPAARFRCQHGNSYWITPITEN